MPTPKRLAKNRCVDVAPIMTMIGVTWTIVIASCLDPLFPDARGLALTPDSNLASDIAFFLFYIGIALVFAVVIAIARKTLVSPE